MDSPTNQSGRQMTLEEAREILEHYEPSIVYPPEIESSSEEAARVVEESKKLPATLG